ncbi:MAG: hypothetical protein L7W43_07855 [Rubripirellula sp.]|nr:hypothetical protein [Rubripirellula sp.]
MSTHIKWITAPILVVGLLIVADTPQAEAQGFSFGTRGLSIQVGQQSPSYHLRAPTCYYPGYNSYRYDYRSPVRRSYGYYPYRPTNIYRYGSHYGGIPGYFNYHIRPHYRYGRHH